MRLFLTVAFIVGALSACGINQQASNEEADSIALADSIAQADSIALANAVQPRVFFQDLNDNDVVRSPLTIQFGVEGIEVEPAGEVREGFGHHHLLINQTSFPAGELIPTNDSTFHYGEGQTEATIELTPGEYTLALQFADGSHASYGPDLATSVRITVQE